MINITLSIQDYNHKLFLKVLKILKTPIGNSIIKLESFPKLLIITMGDDLDWITYTISKILPLSKELYYV